MVKFGTGLLMMAALLLLSLGVSAEQAPHGDAVKGSAKADKLDACVAPTAFMRRNHFELIKHQRHITVHEGIRDTKDSLAGCIDCHAEKDAHGAFVPVNAEEQFCEGCHEYAGVELTCFSCHSPTPTKATKETGN